MKRNSKQPSRIDGIRLQKRSLDSSDDFSSGDGSDSNSLDSSLDDTQELLNRTLSDDTINTSKHMS